VANPTPSAALRTEPRPRCPLCDGAGDWLHTGLVDRLRAAPGAWRYRRCRDAACGLVWLDPRPLESELGEVQRGSYTHAAGQPAGTGGGVWGAAQRLWYLTGVDRTRDQLERLLLADRRPGRLLEIGCGNGARLALLRDAGWKVVGQEVDAEAAAVARQRLGASAIHVGPLAALGLPTAAFDAIASSHVLEHVHEPLVLLRECRRLLDPAGALTAITPNAASRGHARFGRDWFYLDPPRHLQIFTPRALAALAQRAGFTATVRTTSARAQIVAAASLELRHPALAAGGRVARSARDLGALVFQLASHAHDRVARAAGEECVLTAQPGASDRAP